MANGRHVLVTGGTGFTGSFLVKRLLKQGHDVLVVDNQPGRFHDELQALGADIVIGSVTDKELMNRLMAGRDVVHHLAAAFRQIDLPKTVYWNVNVDGTRYLLEAAEEHGVDRFVYCSTCGVHGNVDNPPAAETAPIAPADYYQYTKYRGEEVAREFMQRGLNVTIVRPAAIYGPGDPERWMMLFKRVKPGRFYMFGSGETTYHPLYIDNLVDALVLASEKEEAIGQTYLIADEQYYSLNQLVRATARALKQDVSIVYMPFWPLWLMAAAMETAYKPFNKVPPIFRRRVDWFRQNRAFDISKAKQELGYKPLVDLSTGLARTAEWYREQGYV